MAKNRISARFRIEVFRVLVTDVYRDVFDRGTLVNSLQYQRKCYKSHVFGGDTDHDSDRHLFSLTDSPSEARGRIPISELFRSRQNPGARFTADRGVIGQATRNGRTGEL